MINSFHPIYLVAAFVLSRTAVSLKHSISLHSHTLAVNLDANTLEILVKIFSLLV